MGIFDESRAGASGTPQISARDAHDCVPLFAIGARRTRALAPLLALLVELAGLGGAEYGEKREFFLVRCALVPLRVRGGTGA